ncbi:MAG: PAAR domain-containing protein [Pseudomonadota bacterium]
MPAAARVTDFHECPMLNDSHPSPIPHVGGPVLGPGAPNVLIGNLPAARVGDMLVCVGPPDCIVKGSSTVMIGGMPAARMGDLTAHGGAILMGDFTVMIGG